VLVEEPPCPGAAAWVNWVISGVGDKSIPVTTGASMLELLLKACKVGCLPLCCEKACTILDSVLPPASPSCY
jgi:hypothetical protein